MAVTPRLDSLAGRLGYLIDNVHPCTRPPFTEEEISRTILAEQTVALPPGFLDHVRQGKLAAADIEPFHLWTLAKYFGVSPLFLHTGLATLAERFDFLFEACRERREPLDPDDIGRVYPYRQIARMMLPDGDEDAINAQAQFLGTLRKGSAKPEVTRAMAVLRTLGRLMTEEKDRVLLGPSFLDLEYDHCADVVHRMENLAEHAKELAAVPFANSAARAIHDLPPDQQQTILDVIMTFRQAANLPAAAEVVAQAS